MSFLVDRWPIKDYREVERQYESYKQYLEGVRDQLTPRTYEFAAAAWHYDHDDHRCPHDSWVEETKLKENSEGQRSEIRRLEISILLLGAFHDGLTELTYVDVQSYSIALPWSPSLRKVDVVHGDWLVDEVRLSDNGFVEHEILFSSGSRWRIECRDIRHSWMTGSYDSKIS